MDELKLEMLGAPVLRQKASEVDVIDDELRLLVAHMYAIMYAAEGIGLAGPQVGVGRRVFVVDLNDEKTPRFAMINPQILEVGTELEKGEEGCLSIPGVTALVERPSRVVVEGLDEQGRPLRMEAEGLLARCLQHEIDHLDGVLFIDRLSALKRSMLLKKYRAQQSEEAAKSRDSEGARRSG
jgi:peptide deformylase